MKIVRIMSLMMMIMRRFLSFFFSSHPLSSSLMMIISYDHFTSAHLSYFFFIEKNASIFGAERFSPLSLFFNHSIRRTSSVEKEIFGSVFVLTRGIEIIPMMILASVISCRKMMIIQKITSRREEKTKR